MTLQRLFQDICALLRFRNPNNNAKGLPGSEIHTVNKTLHEQYNVPGHEPRQASDVYRAAHHLLIDQQDTPCFICGVSKSTLNTDKNRCGSSDMEQHHWIIEWSLANAIDWDMMRTEYPDFSDWNKVVTGDPTTYKYFVDSAYNAKILCDIHHRGLYHGIHAMEYPLWICQKYIKHVFPFIPQAKGVEPLLEDME